MTEGHPDKVADQISDAAHAGIGREDHDFTWERTDKAAALADAAGLGKPLVAEVLARGSPGPAPRRKGRAHPASGGSATYRESLFNDSSTELLGRLMYELLDAHADTAYLAAELSSIRSGRRTSTISGRCNERPRRPWHVPAPR